MLDQVATVWGVVSGWSGGRPVGSPTDRIPGDRMGRGRRVYGLQDKYSDHLNILIFLKNREQPYLTGQKLEPGGSVQG
jgi:hypothetical protein